MLGCWDARMLGCLDAWMLGCLDAWMLGCDDAWILGGLVLTASPKGCRPPKTTSVTVDVWLSPVTVAVRLAVTNEPSQLSAAASCS